MDLFSSNREKQAPLAHRMRPEKIEDFLGQNHLLKKNGAIYDMIKNKSMINCIFYGPPGVGKTTIANIIAKTTDARLESLNAVSSGVADVKKVIKKADEYLSLYGKRTYLLLDECHRWSKAQSDSVLKAMEEGTIILLGSTTENPFVSMTPAITSRTLVVKLNPLSTKDVYKGLKRTLKDTLNGYGEYKVIIEDETIELIARKSAGDMRKAYNILEASIKSSNYNKDGEIKISEERVIDISSGFVETISTKHHYDLLSAFCKSIRGGDENAAIYYAHKMIDSGVDPLIVGRRLVVHASEDIGMANSNALLIANAAFSALKNIGPEAIINLTHAIIYVAKANKSDSVISAISKVREDVKKTDITIVPKYLRSGSASSKLYKNPHHSKIDKQTYLPDKLKDKIYYVPNKVVKD